MAKLGLSLKEHRARALTLELLRAADVVLTMTASHKAEIFRRFTACAGHVYTIGEFIEIAEDIADPFGGDLPIYEECARNLLAVLEQTADKIMREWDSGNSRESENTRSSVDPT
jgi:protein-tyrosine-phosphatase